MPQVFEKLQNAAPDGPGDAVGMHVHRDAPIPASCSCRVGHGYPSGGQERTALARESTLHDQTSHPRRGSRDAAASDHCASRLCVGSLTAPRNLSRCASSGVLSCATQLSPGTRGGTPPCPATARPAWSARPSEQKNVVGTRIATRISVIAPWGWEKAAREGRTVDYRQS